MGDWMIVLCIVVIVGFGFKSCCNLIFFSVKISLGW